MAVYAQSQCKDTNLSEHKQQQLRALWRCYVVVSARVILPACCATWHSSKTTTWKQMLVQLLSLYQLIKLLQGSAHFRHLQQ
jgi:hypothetical protein